MRRPRATDTRTAILDAAEGVIAEVGVSAATTRAIARAAGCAEGTLYVHFDSRFALLAGLFERHVAIARDAMQALAESAGQDDPRRNLLRALKAVRSFLKRAMPILAGAYADHDLRETFREKWPGAGFGPERFRAPFCDYIRREQGLGRIARRAQPELVSEACLSLIFFQTFRDAMQAEAVDPDASIEALLKGLLDA